METDPEVVVVGGGLAGLTAAASLACAGRSVELHERAPSLGGRAATHERQGFLFNQGAHALYAGGAAHRLLCELGVAVSGAPPPLSGGFALRKGKLHTLPIGPVSLLSTGLLPLRQKAQVARLLAALARLDPRRWDGVPVARFLDGQGLQQTARELVEAVLRLTTYADAPELADAGASLRQLQMGQRTGVLYLDGGWASIAGGLAERARSAGARLVPGSAARAVERSGERLRVHLDEGLTVSCRAVVLALGPRAACSLLPSGAAPRLRELADAAVPIEAACLDVALRALPRPQALFALGIDAPLYLSVHSAVARLAPPGSALVHTMKYLRPGAPRGEQAERELEALLDRVQPGWRERLVERRWLPRMTVSHALVRADAGGFAGRPSPLVGDFAGVAVAGDWVGPTGMLADASCASGRAAAEACLASLGGPHVKSPQKEAAT